MVIEVNTITTPPSKSLDWLDKAEQKAARSIFHDKLKQLEQQNNTYAKSDTSCNTSTNESSSSTSSTTTPIQQSSAGQASATNAGTREVESAGSSSSTTARAEPEEICGQSNKYTESSRVPSTETNRTVELREQPGRNSVETESNSNYGTGQVTQDTGSHDIYEKLPFLNPAEMYAFFHQDLIPHKRNFHKWQAECNLMVAKDYKKEAPLKLVLNACNGSGKDSFFISPVAVWLAACKIKHRVVITSNSYKQISTQTEPYIREYCFKVNRQLGEEIFDVKQGLIKCKATGSEIIIFVTDDPNNAEGQHPMDDYDEAELTVIINEAKSISLEMFKAFSRYTGFTRWLEISSSGKQEGHMYEVYTMATPYPSQPIPGQWYSRKITVFDCPHIPTTQMEEDAILFGGKDTEFFRSKYLSEYTSAEERVVVNIEQINKCLLNPPKFNGDTKIVAGLDISGGRAETALFTRSGNKCLALETCQIKDATLLVKHLIYNMFPSQGITKQTAIYADGSGMGEPIIDMLRAEGYNVIAVFNQSPPVNKKLYRNRGTSNWFNVGNAIKLCDIILLSDEKLKKQLSRRHYEIPDNERIELLSKKEEVTLGIESPDRADAMMLAFIGFKNQSSRAVSNAQSEKSKEYSGNSLTQQELLEHMHTKRFQGFDGINDTKQRKPMMDAFTFTQQEHIKSLIGEINQHASRNN